MLVRAKVAMIAMLILSLVLALTPASAAAVSNIKVAIIVAPVGDLTSLYLRLAEDAAITAEAQGAVVARAYSPAATPANVLAAVEDANIIMYYGHGYGHPSPYGALNSAKQNGWGLQGPNARGTHEDSSSNGTLQYYGEDWIAANAKPAPGFVMIYSNTCYAPGAGEGPQGPANPEQAEARVGYYSRAPLAMGASAYFAIDFTYGASRLVENILSDPKRTYREVFAMETLYQSAAVSEVKHPHTDASMLLHRTHYLNGELNYWYAFAGDPEASAAGSWDSVPPVLARVDPDESARDVARETPVTVEFDEPLAGVSATSVALIDSLGSKVAGSVWYNPEIYRVTFLPDKPLTAGITYTLQLGDAITDRMGNAIDEQSLTFSTWGPMVGSTESFRIPYSARLSDGEHTAYQFDADGQITDEHVFEADGETRLAISARTTVRGRAGAWLVIAAGEHAGYYLPERAGESFLAGVQGLVRFAGPQPLTLSEGEYKGYEVVKGQPRSRSEVAETDMKVVIDAQAIINGRSYLRIDGGEWDQLWIPETIETIVPDPKLAPPAFLEPEASQF